MATIEKMSRRLNMEHVKPDATANAGLWLERYPEKVGGKANNQTHIDSLKVVEVSKEYKAHFKRWKNHLQSLHPACVCIDEADVQGRMIVGLGAESILETSIALHRTYGVPYIPGSALKGLASAAAHRLFARDDWRKAVNGKPQGDSHRIMFGDTTSAGFVTFHDALFVPPDGDSSMPLDLDVMTVHHKDYYGSGDKPPADWDSPNPISFVTARGTYLIVLEGPDEWTKAAMKILAEALWEEGIGAKTAAGYGRMSLANTKRPSAEKEEQEAAKHAEAARREAEGKAEAARVEAEEKARVATTQQIETLLAFIKMENAADIVRKIFNMVPDDRKQSVAKEIIIKLKPKSLKPKLEKQWVKDLLAAADEKI